MPTETLMAKQRKDRLHKMRRWFLLVTVAAIVAPSCTLLFEGAPVRDYELAIALSEDDAEEVVAGPDQGDFRTDSSDFDFDATTLIGLHYRQLPVFP